MAFGKTNNLLSVKFVNAPEIIDCLESQIGFVEKKKKLICSSYSFYELIQIIL